MSVSFGSASSFTITDGANPQLVANGDTVTFAAGGDLTVLTSATDTVTYSFTESVTTLAFNGGTGELDYTDENGVTSGVAVISTASGNALTYNATGLFVAAADSSSFTLAANSGIAQTISSGDTMTVSGGTGITTLASATDTVTVNYDFASLAVLSDGLDAANDRLVIYNASTTAHEYINIDDIPGFGAEKVTSLTYNGATGNLDYLDELNVTNNIDIISSTPGNTLTFDANGLFVPTPAVITNTNITTGALSAATVDRLADFDSNSLTLDNMSNFVANVNGGGTARFNTDSLGLFGNGVTPPTFVMGGVTGSVILKSPNTVTNYSITWPAAAPAASDYVMSFTNSGVGSFVKRQYFTATGSMPAATDDSVVNMNSNLVNFQNCAGFTVGVQTGNVATLTSPETQLRSPVAAAQSMKFYGGTGSLNYAGIKAPDAIAGTYTITLPTSGPAANNQVMTFNTSGVANFTSIANDNLFTADLTLGATRTHQLDLNQFDLRGGIGVNDGSRLRFSGTALLSKGGDATNSASLTLDTTGANFTFSGSSDLRFDSSVGTAGQFLMTNGSGNPPSWSTPADTHFLNTNLTATGVRTHVLNTNNMFIRGGTGAFDGALFNILNTNLFMLGGASGGNRGEIALNATGIALGFGASSDLRLDGDAGTNGQFLKSRGANLAPIWDDAPSSIDTNITTGTLAAASGDRTVNMADNNLTFDNLNLVTFEGDAASAFIFKGDNLQIQHPDPAEGGVLALADADASRFVRLQAPDVIPATFTLTLPSGLPGSNDQVLSFQTDGTSEFVDVVDSNITAGVLAAATAPRTVDMGTNNLTFDNLNDVDFNGNSLSTFTFDTRNFVIENPSASLGGKLSLADADANRSVSIEAPEVVPTSYSITLPPTAPVSSGQVLVFDTDGSATFGNAAADTNFSTTDLTFTSSRAHFFAGNNVDFYGATNAIDGAFLQYSTSGQRVTLGGGFIGGGNYAWAQFDTTGLDLVFGGAGSLQIDGSAGTAGQILQSNGAGAAPTWETVSAINTNFSTDNLTFTAPRAHTLGGNALTIYGNAAINDGPYLKIDTNSVDIVGGDGLLLDYTRATFGESTLNFTLVDADLRINGVAGVSGQVLTSNGTGLAPTWQDSQETTTSLAYNGSTGNLDYTDEDGTVNNIDIISATGGNSLTFDGTGLYVPSAATASFTLQGDGGSQVISSGDTMTVTGGAGLSTLVSAVDTVAVNYDFANLTALGEAVNTATDRLLIYNTSGTNHRYVVVDEIAPNLTVTTDGNSTGVSTGGTTLAPTVDIKLLGTVTSDNQLAVDTGGGLFFNICDAMGPTTTTITNPTHVWGINSGGTCGWVAVTDC